MISISKIHSKDLGLVEEVVELKDIYELAAAVTEFNWSQSLFQGRKRNLKSFARTDMIVLDVDEGCTLDEAKEIFKPYKHIIGTTRSHGKVKNGKKSDRFRVILFLSQPILNSRDYSATYKSLPWDFTDAATSDGSRFFYPCQKIVAVCIDGKEIDPIEYKEPKKPEQVSSNGKKGDLWKSTLNFLLNGAPDGMWHQEYIKAVGNMREQGYDQAEAYEMLEKITGHLDEHDIKQLEYMYNEAEPKYDFRDHTEPERLIDKASDLLTQSFDYLSDKDAVKGDATGITELDKLLGGGFREGEITVLMAQAKTGKNTLYHYMMHKMLNRGIALGYASRELDPANEVLPNLFSLELGKNAWSEELNADDRDRITKTVGSWELYFAHGYGYFPIDKVEEWFRLLAAQGVKHFWMDHLHYMLKDEDHKEAAQLMRKLKTLAKEFKIHINLIVQPTKLAQDQRLSLNTVRGGAAVGQALDNLLILERMKDKNHKNIARLKLEVARHKLARLGSVFLQYNAQDTSFNVMEKRNISLEQPANTYPNSGRNFNTPRLVE